MNNDSSLQSLDRLFDICSDIINIEREEFYTLANSSLKYYRGNNSVREQLRKLQDLENLWYESLDRNTPDYSLYNNQYLIPDIWACYQIYSKRYLTNIQNKKSLLDKSIIEDLGDINNVVDIGCGIGFTTALLKTIFPNSNIYGTNITNTIQYEICKRMSKIHNFNMISNDSKNISADLIFASEYFEHFEKPIDHLIEIINNFNPKYFLIANSFNSISFGHFKQYLYKDIYYNGREISKVFKQILNDFGFIKVKTKCWNDRPAYYKKI